MSQNTITFKDGTYTVTLAREPKIVYELEGYHLLAVPESTASYYREKVLGPSYYGILYMFYKGPDEPDYLWLSKDEYNTLLPLWNEFQQSDTWSDDESDGSDECDYCHGPVGRCGGRCKDRDY